MTEVKEALHIQFLDGTNTWRTSVSNVTPVDQMIQNEMRMVKRMYPNYRVRAVGMKSGRVYDILN